MVDMAASKAAVRRTCGLNPTAVPNVASGRFYGYALTDRGARGSTNSAGPVVRRPGRCCAGGLTICDACDVMSSELRPTDELVALSAGNHIAEIVRVSHGATDNGPHIDLGAKPRRRVERPRRLQDGKGRPPGCGAFTCRGYPNAVRRRAGGRRNPAEPIRWSLTGKAVGVVVRDHADGVAVAGYVWPGMLPR